MTDQLVIVARIVQFVGAAVLFGAPLFFLYGLRGPLLSGSAAVGRDRMLIAAALLAAIGSVAALLGQTAAMAGDPAAAADPAMLWSVLSGTAFGLGLAVRLAGLVMALAALVVLRAGRGLWLALVVLGAVILASFAWTGHGAADDGIVGLVHLAADLLHLLAAGVWLGALAALLLLALTLVADDSASAHALHDGLAGFSGVGSATVAVLVLTGVVNSWFLVGPDHLAQLGSSAYGLLLSAKVLVFIAMLGLAALNRFRLTPGLARGLASADPAPAVAALRTSLIVETAAGALVLGLVGVLGALEPLSAV